MNEFFKNAMSECPEVLRDCLRREWEPTPFMADVNIEIYEPQVYHWLRSNLGQESSPMHHCEGIWKRGHMTMHGWIWIGFKTDAMLQRFLQQFPQPNKGDYPLTTSNYENRNKK